MFKWNNYKNLKISLKKALEIKVFKSKSWIINNKPRLTQWLYSISQDTVFSFSVSASWLLSAVLTPIRLLQFSLFFWQPGQTITLETWDFKGQAFWFFSKFWISQLNQIFKKIIKTVIHIFWMVPKWSP